MSRHDPATATAVRATGPDRVATWSLRRRFAAIAGMVLVASVGIGGTAMYSAEAHDNDEFRDQRLEQSAAALQYFVESVQNLASVSDPQLLSLPELRPPPALQVRYQVWSREGVLLLRSPGFTSSQPLTALSHRGFATVRADGEGYRVLSLSSGDEPHVIQVAESTSQRRPEIARQVAVDMRYLLISYCFVVGLAWVMLRRAVRAVESTAHQLEFRNPLNLAMLRIDDPPKELLPILNALDMLFSRVSEALSSERRFTAVAAHEMRTPLAGLRAHAQLASAARDDAELQEALRAIRLGVDRVSHLLDQLLDLARLDALQDGSALPLERVKLADVYRAVMLDLDHMVSSRKTQIAARFDAEEIDGHRGALSMMLRNLIANAIAYSPVGAAVAINCAAGPDGVVLAVDDAGPGISQPDRQRAFERFNRLGQTRVEGVGLGLSIVLSVVELHHARIQLLDSPLGGLRVQVDFPKVSSL